MTHKLYLGQTESGKTTLAVRNVKEKRERTGRAIIVLDPNLDPRWEADFITDDVEEFKELVFANKGCEIVIDEAGETIGRHAKEMMSMGTRSRHFGHNVHFIAQRAQQIDKTVRDQCSVLFCFQQSKKDGETLAGDFVDEELKNAYYLEQGMFYYKKRHKQALIMDAFERDICDEKLVT